jgi:hypothetical protein
MNFELELFGSFETRSFQVRYLLGDRVVLKGRRKKRR